MKTLTKIKIFFQNLLSSRSTIKPEHNIAYLTIVATEDFEVMIDFNFNVDNASSVANILYQLDSGLLTGTIVEAITQQCSIDGRDEALKEFMNSLQLISATNKQMTDVLITEPVIKPSQVFKYTVEQPKLN